MKLLNFTIIKITLYFIIGIILGNIFHVDFTISMLSCIVFISLLGILNWIFKSRLKDISAFGLLIFLATVSVGIFTVHIHDQKNFKTHYTKITQTNSPYTIKFKVTDVLKSSQYYDKYYISIYTIDTITVTGNLLLNIKKDSTNNPLLVDDVYLSKTDLKPLNLPLNPYQFNYKKYLNRKHIYHQLSIDNTELLQLTTTKSTIIGHASKLRETINKRLHDYHFSKDELAIINALLLGQRQDISKNVYDSYTKAGAIHILAVSGLHVGIILMLLHYIFKPLERLKKGKNLKIIIIVFLLWSYAFIAGLSPSVVRAVSMFTIFAIAMNLKRPTNIYNTIAISILFLLLFKPNLLFDVGFQMSYLAVLSIVSIEPILHKLWTPRFRIISFFWKILTVTFAAQIGVLPISLFYFHQFPGLFFLSNLVIIPCLGFILGLGILVIVLALLKLLPNVIASCYGFIISKLNSFINWVSLQEDFIFQNIYFNIFYVLFSYLLIISAIRVIKVKTFVSTVILLLCILTFQGYLFYERFSTSESVFIVFHKNKQSIIGFQNNDTLHVYHSMNDSLIRHEKAILNYKRNTRVKTIRTDLLENIYFIKNKNILVIDSLGVYTIERYRPNFVVLRNSPKINLVRLIDSLQPELIISDGSNYKSYQERWEATCKAKKVPFHQTSKKGAFIYRK